MERVATSEGGLQRGRGLEGRLDQVMPIEGKGRDQEVCQGQVEQSLKGSVLVQVRDGYVHSVSAGGRWLRSHSSS